MAILKKEGEWEAGSPAKENRKDKKKKDKKVAKGKVVYILLNCGLIGF